MEDKKMKALKRFESESTVIWSYERGGYFILRIMNKKASYVATKGSKQAHIEEGWGVPFEKKFEDKSQANRYFKKIKENVPELKMVSCEAWKYINNEGKIKEIAHN